MRNAFIKPFILICCLIVLTGYSSLVNQFAFYPDTKIIPAEKLPSGVDEIDHATGEKQLVIIEGAGHNNLSQVASEKYWGSIVEFIRKANRLKVIS